MLEGIYSAASAMSTGAATQEIIARNLANINTTGFKKALPIIQSFSQTLETVPEEEVVQGVELAGTLTDFSQGELQHTNGELDVALRGEGLFVVQTPGGLAYTRKGRLSLADDGTLVTSAGFPVQGQNGGIRIPPGTRQITIDKAGNVLADNQSVGKLQLTTFDDLAMLRPVQFTSFQPANPNLTGKPATGCEVLQGYVEQANVNVVEEMVNMIMVLRNFQMSQKILSVSDQTLAKLTNYANG